jgi:rhodanese-related sulfurtransferase
VVVSEGFKVDEVSPQDAIGLHERGATLLDVREDDEWAAGHAPEAIHVPLARVGDAASRFAGQEVLTVCRSGGRSAKAAETLAQAGIRVHNVAGGMTSWAAAGLPIVRDDGAPAAVA